MKIQEGTKLLRDLVTRLPEDREIPYLICSTCGAIGSTPAGERDKCACGGNFILATQAYQELKQENQELKKANKELLERA